VFRRGVVQARENLRDLLQQQVDRHRAEADHLEQ